MIWTQRETSTHMKKSKWPSHGLVWCSVMQCDADGGGALHLCPLLYHLSEESHVMRRSFPIWHHCGRHAISAPVSLQTLYLLFRMTVYRTKSPSFLVMYFDNYPWTEKFTDWITACWCVDINTNAHELMHNREHNTNKQGRMIKRSL